MGKGELAPGAPCSPPRMPSGGTTLVDTCLETVARNLNRVESLVGLPEELCLVLLHRTLELGALTPRVLQVGATTFRMRLKQLPCHIAEAMPTLPDGSPALPARSCSRTPSTAQFCS